MASELVRWGIPLMAVALANGFVWSLARADGVLGTPSDLRARRYAFAAVGVFSWMGFIAALALAGVLRNFESRPPPMLLVMASAPALAFGVGLSRAGEVLARGTSLAWLVGFQAFRFPLELLMHRASGYGLMPRIMSYSGYNFDVVSGVTALILGVALALRRVPTFLVVFWNVLGSVLLLNIASIAVAASPGIRAFGDEQINGWVTRFPYTWMVVMVTAAALGHIILTRRLLIDARERREKAAQTLAQGSR